MIIDTHIHLSHFLYNQEFPYLSLESDEYTLLRGTREQLIQQLQEAGIKACIDPGIDIESNQRLLSLAHKYPGFVFPAVGVHPTRTYHYRNVNAEGQRTDRKLRWNQRKLVEQCAQDPSVVAIGETGLDYHLDRKEQYRFRQKAWFVWQIGLAHKKKLPVILHIREAEKDAIRILKRYRHLLHGGVCHCFTGTAETAAQYTALGLKIGIGGALLTDTPKRAALEQAVMQTPLEYIVLETDGPYVKPDCPDLPKKTLRKARNTGLILPAVANRIAQLKGISPQEVVKITSANAEQLFRLG